MREHKDSIDYDLQMCGMRPSEAFPHIVVNCSVQLVQHLRKLFLRPHVKRHYHVKCATDDPTSFPRFGIIFYGVEPTKISGVDASIMTQGLNPLVGAGLTMCGSRVISNKNPDRFSTIGCVLRVGQSYYGLTAAHTFVDRPAIDNVFSFSGSEDSDTEDDDYSYDFSGMAAENARNYAVKVSPNKVLDSNKEKSSNQITSTIQDTTRDCASSWQPSMSESSKVYVPVQRTPQVESDLDWALVDLQNEAHWQPNMYTSETGQLKLVSASHVTHLPRKGRPVTIISSRDRAIRGRLRPLPTLRGGPANQANEFWVVSVQGKNTLEIGDSGSIVVDTYDHKVYGHVVSINAYGDLNVVPMKDTIRQIEAVMDSSPVALHSISDKELSQLLNGSIIDTERLMHEWSLWADTLRASRCNNAADTAVAMSKKHRTSILILGLQKYLISTNTVHTTQVQPSSSHKTLPPLWTCPAARDNNSSTGHFSTKNVILQNCPTNLQTGINEETDILLQIHSNGGADYAALAQGSFGTIYSIKSGLHCRDWRSSSCPGCSCENHHKLALKTFKVDDPERLESFSAETEAFRSIQKLSHNNIVKYLGTYQLGGGTLGILFPLADADLKTYMSSSRPTTIHAAVNIFTQLLGLVNALRILHTGLIDETRNSTKRVCHMDLKPSNILLMKDHSNTGAYTWKITDFGVSAIHEKARSLPFQRIVFAEKTYQAPKRGLRKWQCVDLDQAEPLSTQSPRVHVSTNTVKAQGDRAYTAPEVELSNKISGKSDIWSFGCVLVEVLIWLSAGTEVLRRSKEAIAAEDSEHSHGLWVQVGSAKVTLKPTVQRFLDALGECADYEPSLSPLARLFQPGGVLELAPEQRMDATETEDQLRNFVNQKDFEKGVKFLMTDFLSSEKCDRLFPKPSPPNLESDTSRLEKQSSGGLIAGDCAPNPLGNVSERIRSPIESSNAPVATVQGPSSEVEGATCTAMDQQLPEAGKSDEGPDQNHRPLQSDLGENSHSPGDHINTPNDTLMPPRRNSARSHTNIRSCPPKSVTSPNPSFMSTLPRRMTAEEVRQAVTRHRTQNRSLRTVKMRSGGARSLRSTDTHLHSWTGAC